MSENKKINYIPAKPLKREKRVGIYCRLSTNSVDQLKSLTAQVSALTRLTVATPQWLLVDGYMDIASSKIGSSRREFERMLDDCKSHNLEIILTNETKNVDSEQQNLLEHLPILENINYPEIYK